MCLCMHVHVYVCICMCIYIYIHIYIYTYISKCAYGGLHPSAGVPSAGLLSDLGEASGSKGIIARTYVCS